MVRPLHVLNAYQPQSHDAHGHTTQPQADNQYAIWSGLCYCTPLIGGWLADTYLGRFRCIALASCVYLVGILLLVVAVWPHGPAADGSSGSGSGSAASSSASVLIFAAIYVVALGDGGIKPNVCTLGADQYDRSKPQQRREMESFFNYFYWAINIGALISYTVIASIAQFGVPWLGGKEYRFVAGFSIPALATAVAIAIFLFGSPRYKKRPPRGSVVTTAVKVVAEAAWAGLSRRGSRGGSAALLQPQEEAHWLDRAKRSHGGSFADGDVEGVKYVWRLLPFLLFLMPYWVR